MADCVVSGTCLNVQGAPVADVLVKIVKTQQSGGMIQDHDRWVGKSNASGIICRISNETDPATTPGFIVPRGSRIWLKGSFYIGATKFRVSGGVPLDIPDAATATLESLGAAVTGPTTGVTVQDAGSALAHLINTLNFRNGFTVVESPTGVARIDADAAGGGAWGGITGTLSDQTDLQNALNAKQTSDADLTAIAALTPSNDDFIQRKAGAWINRTMAQLKSDLVLVKSDVGLGNVDNVQQLPLSYLDTDTSLAANSDAKVPSQKAIKAYADALVVGLLDDRGNFDASGNAFPSSGGSGTAGAILKGDIWIISVAGTLGGAAVTAGDQVRALVDSPGQTAGNWGISEANIGYVPLNRASNLSDLVSASSARSNLGLVIGTNVQAWDADLDTWATKTAPSGTVVGHDDTQTLSNKTLASPSVTGSITFADNVRQTFNPGANAAGLNVGAIAGDPDTPVNGDLWYDSVANELTARINGANVALGAGGGGGLPSGLTFSAPDFTVATASDNQLVLSGSATGDPVTIAAAGSDPDIHIDLVPKGEGVVRANLFQSLAFDLIRASDTEHPVLGCLRSRGTPGSEAFVLAGNPLFELGVSGWHNDSGGEGPGPANAGYLFFVSGEDFDDPASRSGYWYFSTTPLGANDNAEQVKIGWTHDVGGGVTAGYNLYLPSVEGQDHDYAIFADAPDAVGQRYVWRLKNGITALYNKDFATLYTAGAADFERIITQFNSNVAQIGVEVGGTGTMRPLELLGSEIRSSAAFVSGATSPPTLSASNFTFTFDEANDQVLVTAKYADGTTIKTGAIPLA